MSYSPSARVPALDWGCLQGRWKKVLLPTLKAAEPVGATTV